MRRFFIIWSGQIVSIIGSGLTSFALGVWVYQQTGSVTQYGLIFLCKVLPVILLSPFAGVFVDRWDKRLTMIVGDTGAALSSLGIALLFFTGELQVWHIYLGATVAATFEAFQLPAYQVSATLLVPEKHYGRANGLIQLAQASADILAPMLAGLLILKVQLQGVLLIDFATFLVGVGMLAIVRFPPADRTAPEPSSRRLRQELAGGFAYIAKQPALMMLMLYFALVYFLGGIITTVLGPMVLSFAPPDVLGVVLSVAGSGLFAGSLLLSVWGGPQRRINGVLGFCFLLGLCLSLMGLRPLAWLIAAGAFGAHFAVPFINGCNQTIWQSQVPFPLQGRVFAIRQTVTRAAQPLAFLIAGPLADAVFNPLLSEGGRLTGTLGQMLGVGSGRGFGLMFVMVGILTMVLACAGLLSSRLRQIESATGTSRAVSVSS